MMAAGKKVYFISLGCPKNRVDSEHMLGLLLRAGFEPARDIREAGIAVVNTCGFIREAVEESIDTILDVVDSKGRGKLEKIVVAGCLVQRFGYKLARELPEVDAWLGTGEILRISRVVTEGRRDTAPFYISRPGFLADETVPRVRTTPFYSAYLRLSEGCSHRCAFCMIPRLRGPLRSRRITSLVAEAKKMVNEGVKEVNLIAQDISEYGRDLENGACLEGLLEHLVSIRGLRWIRLLYCHPGGVSDRLLRLVESEEAICPYLDIPFQHVNGNLLKAMGRDPGGERPMEIVNRIRSCSRKISLRTTVMVGFPGETEAAFEELCVFVEEARFEHLGAFVFSREKGARAGRLAADVAPETAKERYDRVMSLQAGISAAWRRRLVGRVMPVLVEGVSPETDLLLRGRTAAMAPEIDGQVLINKGEGVEGEIMPVRITEAYPYDLVGEIV